MSNRDDIATKLREFIHAQFPLARQRQIQDDTSLIERGIVDSLGVLDIVTFVETNFSIVLADDEMLGENFDSIDSLATFVQEKVGRSVSADA